MTVALRGNIRDFGISEVFQLIGQQRKTGVLEIAGSEQRIQVSFSEGAVVAAASVGPTEHAALGDLLVRTGLISAEGLLELEREHESSGERFGRLLIQRADLSAQEVEETEELLTQESLFTLLRWTEGSFHFRPETINHSRDPSTCLPAEQILMDGLRMVDEWSTLDPAATDENTVFQRTGRFETYREHAGSDSPAQLAAAERMLLAVDGRLSVRRLIDQSRFGTFEGARLLSGLRSAGVIEALDPDSLPRARRRPGAGLREGFLRRAGLGMLSFGALLAVVVLLQRPPQAGQSAQLPLLRDPLQAARQQFETRRVRNLVESYRFATGARPGELQELVRRGWLDPEALAPAGGGTYYYASRSETAFVLAPER